MLGTDLVLDRALVVRHGEVGRDPRPDGGEVLADPGRVGVDGLPEDEFVADGEDDGGKHGSESLNR